MPVPPLPGGLPGGGNNTINNSSTLAGWLEQTGLDDLLATTCGCLLGEEEPPPVTAPGARPRQGVTTAQPRVRRGVVKKKAGKTVDGKDLVIEEYPGLFGISPFFGSPAR
jgi:hypothetical protein